MTGNPNGTPKTTDPTHQHRRNNQRSRTNRKILRNDHSKWTPETRHTILRDEPRRRLNNIRIPMATDLQPPDQLGKRKSHDALAEGMGQKEKHLHRPRQTNPKRIPTTLQGVRRERS